MSATFGNVHKHLVTESHIQDRRQWLSDSFSAEELAAKASTRSCDVFAFSRQVPADRWSTRIGGLPAWPVSQPWPDCKKCGEQLAFAGQLDFRNTKSRAMVPGDLLVFHYCFECCPWQQEEQAADQTSWFIEADAAELIEEEIIPDCLEDDEHGPFYGTRHACEDFGELRFEDDPESQEDDERWYYLCAVGTKIGGYPAGIHVEESPEDSSGKRMHFLGMINSIEASDVPKIQDGVRRTACGDLMLADVGCACFFGSQVGSRFELAWRMGSG